MQTVYIEVRTALMLGGRTLPAGAVVKVSVADAVACVDSGRARLPHREDCATVADFASREQARLIARAGRIAPLTHNQWMPL